MKARYPLAALLILAVGLECGYKIGRVNGFRAGYRIATDRANITMQERVDRATKMERDVILQREGSAYLKGRESCR